MMSCAYVWRVRPELTGPSGAASDAAPVVVAYKKTTIRWPAQAV